MNVVTREFIARNGSPTVHHSFFHPVVNSKAAYVTTAPIYGLFLNELIQDNFSTVHHCELFIYKENVLFTFKEYGSQW